MSAQATPFPADAFLTLLRKQKIRQTDLALHLGLSRSALYRKIYGKSDFTRKEILEVSNLLHLDTNEIAAIFFAA